MQKKTGDSLFQGLPDFSWYVQHTKTEKYTK
jgi:uncharacterized short protein YbdD (DUF466 family)